MATIEIPDAWADRFRRFDDALVVIHQKMGTVGISRAEIGATFRTFGCTQRAVWLDPSFCVWAGLRGCVTFSDFYNVGTLSADDPAGTGPLRTATCHDAYDAEPGEDATGDDSARRGPDA